jgi:predicted HAD superfamily Cof-like phosphohydrolase
MTDEATKHDSGKLRYDLVPVVAFLSDAEVFTYGAGKYGDRNWEKGLDYTRLFAAVMRHLLAWRGGEDIDPESGLHHLKHARANLAMILATGNSHDDREAFAKGEEEWEPKAG